MKDIKDLISKITGAKDPNEDKKVISDTVKKFCGFEVTYKNIDLLGDMIKLNLPGPEKNTIFMLQDKIITEIQEKIKDRKIVRII